MGVADRAIAELQQEERRAQQEAADTCRRASPQLHYRTTVQPGPAERTVTVTPPQVAPDETQIWWQWTEQNLAAQKTEIKKFVHSQTEQRDKIRRDAI